MSNSTSHQPERQQPWHYVRNGLSWKQLQNVKNWHIAHRLEHPVECRVWEAVMTAWVMAMAGWLPAYALSVPLVFPLCALGVFLPRLYVQLRADADAASWLRCEWLDKLT